MENLFQARMKNIWLVSNLDLYKQHVHSLHQILQHNIEPSKKDLGRNNLDPEVATDQEVRWIAKPPVIMTINLNLDKKLIRHSSQNNGKKKLRTSDHTQL